MMKMDADVVVMTMPDLENYHIKKSYIRKDIVYVYIPHGIDSINLTQRYKSINAYDIFFAAGKYQREEAEATYKLFNLNNKVYDWGYTLLDDMTNNYKEKKSEAINEAIEWQYAFCDRVISYEELSEETEYFAKIAKRFGLIRMFKQEGII